jgi:opacity protein-like surface antigen
MTTFVHHRGGTDHGNEPDWRRRARVASATAALLAASVLIAPGAARAQSLLEGWSQGSLTFYGWLPSMQGAQEAPDGDPFVDLDSADVLDALDFAFMGAAEIRRGRIGLAFDIEYTDLGADGTAERTLIPGVDPASAKVDTKMLMATGAVAYRFFEENRRWADVYGGVRAYNVESDFTLRVPATGGEESRDSKVTWVDGIVGLRGHAPLGERFGVTGLADIGGFGIGSSSDFTWQVQGTVDYAFTDRLIGRLGYRYLSIDRDSGDLSLDVDVFGPLIGVTWTF